MANLLSVSMIGSVMILVIILLRALLQNRLHRTVFLLLWLLTALRLAVPVMTSSTASIYNFLPEKESVSAFVSRESVPAPVVIVEEPAVRDPVAGESVVQGSISAEISVMEPVEIGEIRSTESLTMGQLLTLFWALGCGACFLYFMMVHIRARLRYRFAIPEKGPDYLGKVALKRSDEVSSPLVYGFFRPVILLPYDFPKKDSPEYEQVLCHELTHIRSGDLWYKLIMLLITCVHWFNPFVWLMLRLSTQDMEIRCDARVIRKLGKKKTYAMTLVRAEVRRDQHFAEAAFAFSLTELRLKSIAKAKVYLPRSIVLFTLVAVILVCCFATGPVATAVGEEIEASENLEDQSQTEPVSDIVPETVPPTEKPAPTVVISDEEEMEYLQSCGFEEYGSTMELTVYERETKTVALKLPEYTACTVASDGEDYVFASGEYSYDEELYYLTIKGIDEGEALIYVSVAQHAWLKIRVTVVFDPYFIVPRWEQFETYGSTHYTNISANKVYGVSLQLPANTTYSYEVTRNGMEVSDNSLSVTQWHDSGSGAYCLELYTELSSGGAVIYFYIDGIYWCQLHVGISGQSYSIDYSPYPNYGYSDSQPKYYYNGYTSNPVTTYDYLAGLGPQPIFPNYGPTTSQQPITVMVPIITNTGYVINPGTYYP